MSKTDLRIDWATHAAAKYACEKWHYSKRCPVFKQVKIGVWEHGKFIGVVMFGQGATPEYGKKFNIPSTHVCELTRVALTRHESYTSRILSISLKFLREKCPNIRLVISFADSEQLHHGGIYQATNWLYAGTVKTHGYKIHGKIEHPKTLHSRYGKGGQSVPWLQKHIDPNAERCIAAVKHRYLMPLDEEVRDIIAPLAKPYPKRPKQAMTGDHPAQRRCDTDRDAPNSAGADGSNR